MNVPTADRLASVKEYYFSKKLREVAQLQQQGKPILNMGIGSPDLPPHPAVVEALDKGMAHPRAHMYQSYQGLPELRQSIADFYQRAYGVSLNSDKEVLPLMGSKEGIMHISMAFLNPGDGVLIPNPGYPTYSAVTELVQAKPVFYELKEEKNWQPDFEALERLDTTNIKLMWLNYPNMPTGAQASELTFIRLIEWAKKNDILLINDNPYSFILNDRPSSILAVDGAKEVALELNSLSKSFNMAGWRVGMLLGEEKLIHAVLKVKSNMDSGMFYGIQQGAIAALGVEKSWQDELNTIYRKRRLKVEELARTLGSTFDPNSVGMFLWCKLPEGSPNAEAFIDQILYKNDLFITPGTIFGSQGEGYIRFSLCIEEQKIETAIQRLKK